MSAATAPQPTSGAAIRAFVDSMPEADDAASPPAAAGAQSAGAEEAAAEEAAPQRTDFLAAGPNYLDLSQLSGDFAPLSSRGPKQGKKRQRQVRFSMCRTLCACVVCIILSSSTIRRYTVIGQS